MSKAIGQMSLGGAGVQGTGGEWPGEQAFGAGVLVGHEVRLGKPERIVCIIYVAALIRFDLNALWGDIAHALVQLTILSPQNAAVS